VVKEQQDLKGTVFMVMPFSDSVADKAYRLSTKPVVEEFGLRAVRADEIFSANPVFDDIIAAIEQAALVIVDISGQNENCFYELGVAHTLKRSRTIMITHDPYQSNPFDIAHFRIIQYQDSFSGKDEYESKLRNTIKSITSGIPDIFADEFGFFLNVLKASGKEHEVWGVQAIALSARPFSPSELTWVEGTCPQTPEGAPGMSRSGQLVEFLRPFCDTGYVVTIGDHLALTEKGRAFADYCSSLGYEVLRFNDQIFKSGYVSPYGDDTDEIPGTPGQAPS
jgi:hypothetical protein